MLIYKILLPSEWTDFETAGHFDGSALDGADGFIHCSSRDQVSAVATRYFAPEQELVIVALDSQAFEDSLRWEASSGGEPYPHVYAPLSISAVVQARTVAGPHSVDAALSTS
jgi:uncharacterized protein (DUF952 family)